MVDVDRLHYSYAYQNYLGSVLETHVPTSNNIGGVT